MLGRELGERGRDLVPSPSVSAAAGSEPPSSSVPFAATSPRTARARLQSIARLTAIRCSHGAKGRRRSKRSRALSAERKASWAMSSAAAASRTIR